MKTSNSTSPSAKPSEKARRKLFPKIAFTALLLIGTIVAASVAAVETEFGRAQVFRLASYFLEREAGIELKVGRTHGSLLGPLEVESLSLADDQGVWLETRALRLDWEPFGLADRQVRIGRLSADA
ncbi:MAG: hypothetical protein R3245_12450, partial [Kiloniellales bacterium]|nr:hypothetical protein [Kiloniellales bacterium]